ncbi:hypothetical protein C8R43DRAFT_956360 [Mycena crocata]|nr:hypothetical protein C8R43DRAFT_956360 [Mycena crocata]
MHRALRIPELVAMICAHIFQYPESFDPMYLHGSLPSLYAFGRTCKLFLGPSLDIMWSRQYGLQHFIDCMPSGIWEEPLIPVHGFHLIRPITPSDWERPSIYTPRMRQFVVTTNDFRVLDILGLFLPGTYLFANLDTIRCLRHSILLPHIRLLLGPKIHTIVLDLGEGVSDLSVLPVLTQRYPTLRDVRVKINFIRTPTYRQLQSVSLFARGLTHIEYLTLDIVDAAAFRHLGQLATLKSLTTGLAVPAGQIMACDDTIGPFPALRTLRFTETTTEIAAAYIALTYGCSLTILEIDIRTPSTAAQTATLYTALATNCTPSALELLLVENSPTYFGPRDDAETYVVSTTTLRTLYCFANLTNLSLQSPVGFELDNAATMELAQAWPRLQFCGLKPDTGVQDHASGIPLVALRAFAQHCPDLIYLSLTLDATLVPTPLPIGTPHVRPIQQKLIHLDVGRSPASEPDAASVAGYLSGLFPRLRTVSFFISEIDTDDSDDEDEGDGNAKAWGQVRTLLPLMQGLRSEERAWTNQSGAGEDI